MNSWPTKTIAEVERLKAAGRGRERKSEWWAALGEYEKAIRLLSRVGMPAPHLHNHAGDLYMKVELESEAVQHYERAIDLYVEEGQTKSAIGLCRKVLRRAPDQLRMVLRMGQIRAAEGFYLEAREDLLRFVNLAQNTADVHTGFDALVELAKMTPGDIQLRFELSDMLVNVGRNREALALLEDPQITAGGDIPQRLKDAIARRASEVEAMIKAPPMPPANLPPSRLRRVETVDEPPTPAASWMSQPSAGMV